MKKNIRLTMTALAAALCMTAAMPVYATEDYSLEIHDLQVKADDLQSQLDQLKAHIDELAGKTGVSTSDASAAGTATDAVADGETAQGQNILLNETVEVPDFGSIMVYKTEFVSNVEAPAAAEDSLKMSASAGNVLYHAQIVGGGHGCTVGELFSVYLVVDGKKYENGRRLFEAMNANGSHAQKGSAQERAGTEFSYLVNAENNSTELSWGYGNFALFDYVVEVPEDIASTASNVYLQFKVQKTDLNYTVPLS